MRLHNKVLIVTGAGSGIGATAVKLFAAEGGKVVATDVQLAGVQAVVEEVRKSGGIAIALSHNVSSGADWKVVVDRAVSEFGQIDVLLNNAGVGDKKPLPESTPETTDEEDWSRVIDVNLKGVFLGMKYVLPFMKNAGKGSIINVSSIAAIVGSAGPFAYTASKGGVRSMTKHVAFHYGRFNIRANSIHPSFVKTPMVEEDFKNKDTAERIFASVPLSRFSETIEIANVALFLASDESSYLTGAELVVDGGLTIA
ncbi:MAG TPA: SDR family NAD(P)-dependent oxidoreductase [Pseudomonas sp.]|uniref:SDR family NAD(P)-dependent oxidoreductase n=1 Tax=Pseudomonas sp. TaxID=306 RepID=UPI002ED84A37